MSNKSIIPEDKNSNQVLDAKINSKLLSRLKSTGNPLLDNLLKSQELILRNSYKKIVSKPPLVKLGETEIFRNGTVNLLQGKFGSHKSRIAELFCSLMLSNIQSSSFLSFYKPNNDSPIVVYIDTERNQNEEFPSAALSIRKQAGFGEDEWVENFHCFSLIETQRKNRKQAIELFFETLKLENQKPIFAVFDVSTDCVDDFNSIDDTNGLFDYLNILTEKYSATVLLVIHENPMSIKPRGHVGTEGSNKSSTVMRVSFVKKRNGEYSDIIALEFLKTRRGKRPEPIYLQFSEEHNGLISASEDKLKELNLKRTMDDSFEEITDLLSEIMEDSEISQKVLRESLMKETGYSKGTILSRLKHIEKQNIIIVNQNGAFCNLSSKGLNGSTKFYFLRPIEEEKPLNEN